MTESTLYKRRIHPIGFLLCSSRDGLSRVILDERNAPERGAGFERFSSGVVRHAKSHVSERKRGDGLSAALCVDPSNVSAGLFLSFAKHFIAMSVRKYPIKMRVKMPTVTCGEKVAYAESREFGRIPRSGVKTIGHIIYLFTVPPRP